MTSRSAFPLLRFTGERLHPGSKLFDADLARHEAAYRFTRSLVAAQRDTGRIVDLGAGSGYGSRSLAGGNHQVVGLDRVVPDPLPPTTTGAPGASFVVGDLLALPLRRRSFTWLVSFQVIEHLSDPHSYLATAAQLLEPGGTAILSTPNRLTSDGVNPHHVHEYGAAELAALLAPHFRQVELRGVGASARARSYQDARLRQIRALLRLDLLGLRQRLPRPLVDRAFGILAVLVRVLVRRRLDTSTITWEDYPIGPYTDDCLDLLAVCRP